MITDSELRFVDTNVSKFKVVVNEEQPQQSKVLKKAYASQMFNRLYQTRKRSLEPQQENQPKGSMLR